MAPDREYHRSCCHEQSFPPARQVLDRIHTVARFVIYLFDLHSKWFRHSLAISDMYTGKSLFSELKAIYKSLICKHLSKVKPDFKCSSPNLFWNCWASQCRKVARNSKLIKIFNWGDNLECLVGLRTRKLSLVDFNCSLNLELMRSKDFTCFLKIYHQNVH